MHTLAARLGLAVAAVWTLSFLIVVRTFPGFFCELGYLVGLFSVVIVSTNLRHARQKLMPIPWWQGLTLCLLSFMGGTLITTLVQYIYFAFVDGGHFINLMAESMQDPALAKAMKEAGNSELLEQMKQIMGNMQEMTPRELTMQLFSTNVTFTLLFSLLSTLFAGRAKKK